MSSLLMYKNTHFLTSKSKIIQINHFRTEQKSFKKEPKRLTLSKKTQKWKRES